MTATANNRFFLMLVATGLAVCLLCTVFAKTAAAAEGEDCEARRFVESMGSEAINFLGDENLAIAEKEKKFSALLNRRFDMETIGRFSLGARWRDLDNAQRKEYQELFREMIVQIYSRRFSDYQGQDFEVNSVRMVEGGDSLVRSYIVPDRGNKILVEWRLRDRGGKLQIVDVIIEQVSMSMTQRSDFNSIIQRGGGNAIVVLDYLRSRTNSRRSENTQAGE